jgi:hypothetical protein
MNLHTKIFHGTVFSESQVLERSYPGYFFPSIFCPFHFAPDFYGARATPTILFHPSESRTVGQRSGGVLLFILDNYIFRRGMLSNFCVLINGSDKCVPNGRYAIERGPGLPDGILSDRKSQFG